MVACYVHAVANPIRTQRLANADFQQAEYFLALLGEECDEVSEHLAHHRAELVIYEHAGDLPGVRRKQRVIRALEKDLLVIEQMMTALWKKVAPTENRRRGES